MASPSDPTTLARSLTPAQRRALLWLPEDHEPRILVSWAQPNRPRFSVFIRLRNMGLVDLWSSFKINYFAVSLSVDPGYAVRAALAKGDAP